MDGGRQTAQFPAPNQNLFQLGFAPSRWISAAEFAALRHHPSLPSAVAAFASSLIDLYEGDALRNALLCDRGRVLLGFFILYLDAHGLPGTNERGATLSAVQALCRDTGLCSPGRASSVLAAMRFGGYVMPRRDPDDRRRRLLVPSPLLIAAHHEHWVCQFEAMAAVFPTATLVPTRLQTASFQAAFLYELGNYFLTGFRVLDHAPTLIALAESNAGLLLTSSLALPQLSGVARWGEPIPISISALSRRFCVSRAHVRNILAVSERRGLLAHACGSEDVIIHPALTEALIQFYGVLFLLFDRCTTAALERQRALTKCDPLN